MMHAGRWRISLCIVFVALSASGQAQVPGQPIQFSPDGNFVAIYPVNSTQVTVVGSYRNWPGVAPTTRVITMPAPNRIISDTGRSSRKWRIANDGSVWLIIGTTLRRYSADAENPQSLNLQFNIPLQASTMGFGDIAAAIFLTASVGGRLDETRCVLDQAIFEPAAFDRFCTTTVKLNEDTATDARTGAVSVLQNFRLMSGNAGYADYAITKEYWGVQKAACIRKRYLFKNGTAIFSEAKYCEDSSPANNSTLALSSDGKYLLDESAAYRTKSNWLDKFSFGGTNGQISPDGKFAFSQTANPPAILVKYLAENRNDRTVSMGDVHDLAISPNGRFFIYGDLNAARPLQYLTAPYMGVNKDIAVDIVMAKITTALKAQNWSAALPAFDELAELSPDAGEEFDFYWADTLFRAGRKVDAQQKASQFVIKYGKNSSNYPRMIEILAQ